MAKIFLIFSIILSIYLTVISCHQYFNDIHPNRTLIVLSAPSIWDDNYKDDFFDIIQFQIDFVNIIHEHENVVILADKHTMPYLDGRSSKIKKRLPYDALLEANVYDVNINDFAPMGYKQFVKFIYRSDTLVDLASSQIDLSMNRFLMENKIKIDKYEQEMILSGENIVHNGINKALITDNVIIKNAGKLPDWAMMIKLLNAYKKILIIGNPANGTKLRFDDILGFIDEEMLAISPIDSEVRQELEIVLKKKFRNDLELIDLPIGGPPNDVGNCGIYTAVMSTPKYVYLPVYGSDTTNWEYGYSSITDKMVIHLLEANSKRKIIPINVPRSICQRGLSLRSMSWTIKGYAADTIINLARNKFV